MRQKKPTSASAILSELEKAKQFDPDVHIPELLSMSESGMTEAQICRSWHIDKNTWYSWVRNNEPLKSVLGVARTYFESYWAQYCIGNLDSKKIDKNLWSFLAKDSGLFNINALGIDVDFSECDEGNVFSYANKVLSHFISGYISSNKAQEMFNVLESFSLLMLNEEQVKELTLLRGRLQDAIDSVREKKN